MKQVLLAPALLMGLLCLPISPLCAADAVPTDLDLRSAYCLSALEAGVAEIEDTCGNLRHMVDQLDSGVKAGTMIAPTGAAGDLDTMRGAIAVCSANEAAIKERVNRLKSYLAGRGWNGSGDPPTLAEQRRLGTEERNDLEGAADACSAACVAANGAHTDNLGKCINVCLDHRGYGEKRLRVAACSAAGLAGQP